MLREIEKEKKAFNELPDEEKAMYTGKWVAVYGGEIVDADDSLFDLIIRFNLVYGRVPVYMMQKVGDDISWQNPFII